MLNEQHRLIIGSLDDLVKREVLPIAARVDRDDALPEGESCAAWSA